MTGHLEVASSRGRSAALMSGAVVLTVVMVAGLVACGNQSDAGANVTLVPAGTAGADPFTESVQVGAVPTLAPPAQAAAATARKSLPADGATGVLVATGTTPGLYGGSGDEKVCDPARLVDFLAKNPKKAAAWAKVLGTTPDDISDYVAGLTPVVLTADTFVTNHGFRAGRATASRSVLQAGTAVMVDDTGVPRVKCNCGNPLTPPELVAVADVDTVGDAWDGYDPKEVTAVHAGDSVDHLTLLDCRTGTTYDQPIGSGDGVALPAPAGLDGDWTISLRRMTDMMADDFVPSDEQVRACPTARLDGLTMHIDGDRATIADVEGVGAMAGPVDGGPGGPTVQMTGGTRIRLRPSGKSNPEVTLAVLLSGDTLSGVSHLSLDEQGSGMALGDCQIGMVLFRVGGASNPSAVSTTTVAAPALPPLTDLPAGLLCKDLAAQGRSYQDAMDYWRAHGQPVNMDADGNGIPCETVYPRSDVVAVWGEGPAVPTSVVPAGIGQCTVAAMQSAWNSIDHTGLIFDGVGLCDGSWAVPNLHTDEGEDSVDIAGGLFRWNGQAWVDAPCEDYRQDPDVVNVPRPGTVPQRIFEGGCAVG